ncbi:MAG: rod-binding protein [Treponema sp.]|nr:rod-binding protein [Treponema sp.]
MNTISGGYSSITHGESALQGAKITREKNNFESLLKKMSDSQKRSESGLVGNGLSSSMVAKESRLNGDYGTGFSDSYKGADAKESRPIGAAANQAHSTAKQGTIDRTSELYEKSLEMESYIVKMMLSSMRKTIVRADGSNDFARNMYEDMLYDEYATAMTKNAGFGLADQMYLQLSGQAGVDAKSVLA